MFMALNNIKIMIIYSFSKINNLANILSCSLLDTIADTYLQVVLHRYVTIHVFDIIRYFFLVRLRNIYNRD